MDILFSRNVKMSQFSACDICFISLSDVLTPKKSMLQNALSINIFRLAVASNPVASMVYLQGFPASEALSFRHEFWLCSNFVLTICRNFHDYSIIVFSCLQFFLVCSFTFIVISNSSAKPFFPPYPDKPSADQRSMRDLCPNDAVRSGLGHRCTD